MARIFSKLNPNIAETNVVQKVKYNREQLLSKETAKELNTYLNFGVFPTYTDTFIPYYENGKLVNAPSGDNPKNAGVGTPGVRSLFNRAGAVLLGSSNGSYNVKIYEGDPDNTHWWRISNNVPLMDSPAARIRIRKSSGCSIKELVDASQQGLMGQETYAYSDFMYCKHLGKIPNNYLITLRRFPYPVDDYIGAQGEEDSYKLSRSAKNAACIGCMVNWIGVSGNELSNLLKYSYKMPFKTQDAELQDNSQDADTNQTMLNSIFSVFDTNYQKQYMNGYAGEAARPVFDYLATSRLGSVPGVGYALKNQDNGPYKNNLNFQDKNIVEKDELVELLLDTAIKYLEDKQKDK